MAKAKSKVNKSAAIREYSETHPGEGPTAIAAALAKKGIAVKPAAVSTILSKAGLSKKRKTRKSSKAKAKTTAKRVGRPAGSGRSASKNGALSLDSLVAAKKFVTEAGSADKAIELIRGLQKLDIA